MAKESKPTLTIIRRNEVEARTGLSRSTIYAKMRPNPKYPNVYDCSGLIIPDTILGGTVATMT
ncbi:AlpA family phage regulatory protein [Aeromonas veronii]